MAPKRKDPPTEKGQRKGRFIFRPETDSWKLMWMPAVFADFGAPRKNSYTTRKPHLAYPLLVKEFFANFNQSIEDPATDHQYTTWVRGKWIQFSPAVIAHYYELPALDFEPIPADFDMTQRACASFTFLCVTTLTPPPTVRTSRTLGPSFYITLQVGTELIWGNIFSAFIVELASQYASGRSPMFPCLISALCLAGGVPLLPHEEPENHEPPITKRTLGNPVARRAADNPAPPPAAETDRLLRQMFTQLSEQGRVLNSIQRTQLAMQRTVDHMRIEIDSLRESNNTLRGGQRTINFTYDDVNRRMLQFAQRLDDIYTVVSQPSASSAPHHGSTPADPSDHP
ncbi:Uncharacterized protein Adt_14018 [Abeliophyllum distichum]|uniref:Putative plant transposon protein domain-containing protein n=1 Tax=Abeliophyllum distichum TaxID=126358 RepID=A0ABD1TYG0_9LAMI